MSTASLETLNCDGTVALPVERNVSRRDTRSPDTTTRSSEYAFEISVW